MHETCMNAFLLKIQGTGATISLIFIFAVLFQCEKFF